MAVPSGHNIAMGERPGAEIAEQLVSPFADRHMEGAEPLLYRGIQYSIGSGYRRHPTGCLIYLSPDSVCSLRVFYTWLGSAQAVSSGRSEAHAECPEAWDA